VQKTIQENGGDGGVAQDLTPGNCNWSMFLREGFVCDLR
jgi:hypothetical protein